MIKVGIISNEEKPGYVRHQFINAFNRIGCGIHIRPLNISGTSLLDIDYINNLNLDLLIFGDLGIIPRNIRKVNCLIACFQFDTYAITAKRIKESKLFDIVFVFHKSFVDVFKRNGIRNVFFIPYCIDPYDIEHLPASKEKFEVAFVGDIKRPQYSIRRDYVKTIEGKFKHNDFSLYYTWDNMISLYKSSSIVVNIPRNDYLVDANLRCVEAMACGSLLFTLKPTELSQLGFKENQHFIGFDSKEDLLSKLGRYISDREDARMITIKGQKFVQSNFTYDFWAGKIVEIIAGKEKTIISTQAESLIFVYIYLFHNKINKVFDELMNGIKNSIIFIPLIIHLFILYVLDKIKSKVVTKYKIN